MLRRLALFSLASLLLVSAAAAQDVSGSWTATLDAKRSELNVQFHVNADKRSQLGMNIPLAHFSGLAAGALSSPSADAKFQLVREAGTTSFDGHFRNGKGVGEFTFTASPQYRAEMAQLGYSDISDRKMFELAIINVTTAYTKELKSLGFSPTLQKLIEARIFNVNREQIEGLKAVGYQDLALKDLIELRIFDVTPKFITDMRSSGIDLPLKKYVEMKIHNVTPEFRREMAAAGYPDLPFNRLVEFRIHGVTPAYIQEMKSLGFSDLPASKLVEFRIFNVNADQIAELKSLGYSGVTAQQLVNLRIHGVDRAFIEKVRKAGHDHPSIQQLIDMKIMGIRRNAKLM